MADTLIARLEKAKSGSRALSDECLLAVGWVHDRRKTSSGKYTDYGWIRPDGSKCYTKDVPDPSQNAQDAIDWMLPEGWYIHSLRQDEDGFEAHIVDPKSYDGEGMFDREGIAGWNNSIAAPALALSAAGLKALEAGI